MKENFVTQADFGSELNSLRADVASDLIVMRKELGKQMVALRRAVIDYPPRRSAVE